MKTTQPLVNKNDIKKLLDVPGRDGFLFSLALYTALRVGEYRMATWGCFVDEEGRAKESHRFEILKKRKKSYREIYYPSEFVARINKYYEECGKPSLDVYVFQSKRRGKGNPISIKGINDHIVKPWFITLGIDAANNSSHTLRKTKARYFYDQHGLVKTMEMLGHTSEKTTLKYLGLTSEVMQSAHESFTYEGEGDLIEKIKDGTIQYKGLLEYARAYHGDIAAKDMVGNLLGLHSNNKEEINDAMKYIFI